MRNDGIPWPWSWVSVFFLLIVGLSLIQACVRTVRGDPYTPPCELPPSEMSYELWMECNAYDG